jgi:hypothetical protein
MSGYDKDTGIFELTITKAQYWHRLPIDKSLKYTGMRYYVELLKKAGLKVDYKYGSNNVKYRRSGVPYAKVHATPGQIWTALSGQPADPVDS